MSDRTDGFDSSSRQLHFNVGFIKEQRNNSVLTSELLREKCFNMTALLNRQSATREEREGKKERKTTPEICMQRGGNTPDNIHDNRDQSQAYCLRLGFGVEKYSLKSLVTNLWSVEEPDDNVAQLVSEVGSLLPLPFRLNLGSTQPCASARERWSHSHTADPAPNMDCNKHTVYFF